MTIVIYYFLSLVWKMAVLFQSLKNIYRIGCHVSGHVSFTVTAVQMSHLVQES
jgi:hypothetical protein